MDGSEEKPPGVIPVLTDVAADSTEVEPRPRLDENRLAELQTELASRSFALTDQLLHAAFQEMEAALFEQVANRLRNELPEMIDQILRDYLEVAPGSED
jgi:uncharacterized protein (DUF2267 family)